jgi:type IV pilus assembly protein PilE
MRNKISRKGFSLIELMIVLGIIAILVALALPSYSRYVRKANRGEAMQLILNYANNQEIFRANAPEYATVDQLALPSHTNYDFTLPTRTATTFTLVATAKGDQAKDEEQGAPCTILSLTQANAKDPVKCW